MDDRGDWDALASEMVRQNCAFVASCSVILWDYLLTLGEEVQYIWRCPSKMTKYLFLFCRYWTMGYYLVYSIFGIQWTLHIPIARKDCRTWFLTHVASVGLLYTGSQLTLIRKIFNLYGRSLPLAVGLFALQFIQVTGILILSHHISGSLNFNPICNGINLPNIAFSVLVTAPCCQCITWALILPKVWRFRGGLFPKWRHYLYTSETYARMSWGVAIVAIMCNTSHSFTHQRIAPVYVLTFPMTVLSIGTCRYILRIERDRDTRAKLIDTVDIDDGIDIDKEVKGKGKQRAIVGQLPVSRHLYPPRPPAATHPPSDPEAPSTRSFSPESVRHRRDGVVSNFPYLHGAQSYFNRRSMATATTNGSPRSSSDGASRQTGSVRPSHSRGSGAGASSGSPSAVDSADTEMQNADTEMQNADTEMQNADTEMQNADTEMQNADTDSASDIEIGSLQSSSSVDSEQLRRFYNDTWNVGPFMAGGP